MASLQLGRQHQPDNYHHDHGGAAVKLSSVPVPPRRSDMDTDKEMSAAMVEGNDAVTGHIISTTIGGKNGEPKRAKCLETGESVAIKKVLQDRRYKNRELQIMRLMDHPNVISLKYCFFSTTSRDELFLNLVMDYVPETLYKVLKHYSNSNQRMPLIYVKLYSYQIFRALAYIHTFLGVSHRDVKPQNILVDPLTHQIKICDFGSAKVLVGVKQIYRISARVITELQNPYLVLQNTQHRLIFGQPVASLLNSCWGSLYSQEKMLWTSL